MIKFSSIESLRHVVTYVRKHYDHIGQPYPTVNFTGTCKIHGSNGSVSFTNTQWHAHSRENTLSLGSDNAGFYAFVHPRIGVLAKFKDLLGLDRFVIFGEWCGGNIQKGVAVCQLPKHFVIFNIWSQAAGDEGGFIGLPKLDDDFLKELNANGIWSIEQIPSYSIDVDFNNPQKAADELTDIILAVEDNCPWGAFHGVTGIGEGIVFKATNRPYDSRLWFKAKGLKHKGSDKTGLNKKVKLYASPEKVNEINELVDLLLPEWRLEQAMSYINDVTNNSPTNKQTGAFLKWIHGDVLKEETDVIVANGKEWKDVVAPLSKKAKFWYFRQIGEDLDIA